MGPGWECCPILSQHRRGAGGSGCARGRCSRDLLPHQRSPAPQSVTAAGARRLCNMYLMSGLSSDIIPPCWHIADLCISDACNPPEPGVRGASIRGCQGRVF